MNPGPLVMMLGISGVGKSYLSRMIFERRPDVICLSAGALLKNLLEAEPEQLRTASREVVLANQMLLPEEIRRARSGRWQQTALLEAHSVIDNDHELIDVPLDLVNALGVAGIILVEEHVAEIKRRREADQRSRPNRSLFELGMQEQISNKIAVKYADKLSLPLKRVYSGDFSSALNFIYQLERESQSKD